LDLTKLNEKMWLTDAIIGLLKNVGGSFLNMMYLIVVNYFCAFPVT